MLKIVGSAIVLMAAVWIWFLSPPSALVIPSSPSGEVMCTMDAMQCPDGSYVGRTGPHCEFVCPSLPAVLPSVQAAIDARADEVVIVGPLPLTVITRPLTVQGKARGNWFFEGTFPVTIETASGTVVGSSFAQATADAYTTNLVPFTATVTWTDVGDYETGLVRVRRDNPSGLPENDADLAIPIRFAPVATSQGL